MPKTHTPHLVRRGDGFYFRRAIPLRLRGRFGRTEVRYSLKTQNLRMAKMRCRHFSNLFDKLIVEVEAMPNLDQQTINEALWDYFAQEWSKLRSSLPTAADGEAEVQMQLYGASEAPEVVRGWFRKKSYPPYVRSVAKQVLVSAGIDVEHLLSETMDAVCEGIARASSARWWTRSF